jgi:hypothetical protein
VAKEVGFIERESKMKAYIFLDMLISQVFDKSQISLNDHSVELGIKHAISITKQGIDDNFTAESTEFVRTLVEQQLQDQLCKRIPLENLKNFTSIKIKDSTRFQVPNNLKNQYPGCGGGASEAGVHIQFEFDLLSGKIADVHVSNALQQDSTDALETVEMIEPGSLLLRDMGYFNMDILEQIDQQGAFFISRLRPKVKIYEHKQGSYQLIDIKKIHRQMKDGQLAYQELSVYIGEEKKLPVRLIIELMPEEIVNRRLAKVNAEAKKKKRQVSEEYKAYTCLNFFISNVEQQWLTTPQIHSIYRLRWQIELRFKIWKSYYHIHANKKMKLHRFETYLYATLLFILINWEIVINLLTIIKEQTGQILSVMKCYKALVLTFGILKEALFNAVEKLQPYLEQIYKISIKQLLLEKRKCHLSLEEILYQNEFCAVYYNNN